MVPRLFLSVIFALVSIASALSSVDLATPHALVIYDPKVNNLNETESLSTSVSGLINSLENIYVVTYKTYDDENINLFYEDAVRFDHLVLLPSSKKAIGAKDAISQHKLLNFINQKGNVLVVGSVTSVLPDGLRTFLNELGIYPSPKNFKLIDHFNSAEGGKVKLSDELNVVKGNGIVSSIKNTEYEGSAALISNNEYIFPIIKSSATGFSAKKDIPAIEQDTTWTFGEQGFLAVGLQALNNARLTWVGSESLLDNEELSQWAFQQKNVLRLKFVEHYKSEAPEIRNPKLYRIKDQTIYAIGVTELVNGKWVPYEVTEEENQIQLSFKLLDPYQRLDLQPLGPIASTKGSEELDAFLYFANFTIPDHHGVFTFELNYKRNGLTYLVDKKVVTVRHLANDEYKRSWDIPNAWLYVASAFLVTVAWFLFVVNYIYVGKTDIKKKNI
ncbi:oligosaccharyl transferase beta subunit precursor [Scheffersomyces xylosifermentans]|uniref:oligosaccharyl transferase beta subunit precursor n=1 Tax=Scheffersomyces xylosifermentans TaxID=1304137 RepID=UPI00315D8480